MQFQTLLSLVAILGATATSAIRIDYFRDTNCGGGAKVWQVGTTVNRECVKTPGDVPAPPKSVRIYAGTGESATVCENSGCSAGPDCSGYGRGKNEQAGNLCINIGGRTIQSTITYPSQY